MSDERILIVEDEVVVAEDIKQTLEKTGYRVVDIVGRGEEAVEMARRYTPDLVLMDIVLKGKMDGIEAADTIKSELNVPVVYLTAYIDEEKLERAKVTESFGYILKPFDNRELHGNIEMALYKHKMEKELKRERNELQIILDSVPTRIWYKNTENKIIKVNRALSESVGMSPGEMEGKNAHEIFPELAQRYSAYDQEVLTSGKPKQNILEKFDGVPGETRWVLTNIAPYRDENDKIIGTIAIALDITERKKAEKNLKMERKEFSEFIDGISHDIQDYTGRIREKTQISLPKGEGVEIDPKKILNITKEMEDVSQEINDFIKKQAELFRANKVSTLVDLDLNKVVDSVAKKHEIRIEKGDLPVVNGNRKRMEDVFNNLIEHAIVHGKADKIRISSEKSRNSNIIFVKDNGEGIPKEKMKNIFDFKYSKTGRYRLTLVKKIIEAHNGRISADSKEGEGTIFMIKLPKIL
jgi:PAS domain S-box-containing protein